MPAGSDGLLFLPYLSGERSPHPDPLARGAFVGLTLGHDRRHLTRAVLEGVAFGLRDGLDLMVDAGMPAPGADPGVGRRDRERACGARSSPTSSRRRSRPSSTTEGAAYGAGLLAAVGAGWFPSRRGGRRRGGRRDADGGTRAGRGPLRGGLHARYRELYPALAPLVPARL